MSNDSPKIGPEQVRAMATLSRLKLPEDTLERFAPQLAQVVEYMDILAEVDTQGVEPLYSPVEQVSVLREDVAAKDLPRDAITANAPQTDGQFFIVPKIV